MCSIPIESFSFEPFVSKKKRQNITGFTSRGPTLVYLYKIEFALSCLEHISVQIRKSSNLKLTRNSAFLAELKAGLYTTTVEVWLFRYWEARRFISEAGPTTYVASHHRLTSTTTLQVRRNPNRRGSTEETLQKAWVTCLISDSTNMIRKGINPSLTNISELGFFGPKQKMIKEVGF
ncbi:hypothetical protein YC2023_017279 [Brassica napus]